MALVAVKTRSNPLTRIVKQAFGAHNFTVLVDRSRLIIKNQYDANESLWNLFTFSGTTIQFIIFKPVTWFCIALHYFGFFYMQSLRADCTNDAECWVNDFTKSYSIKFGDITIFTTLVVFLFVSYNNMCYRILEKQYFSSQSIAGRISSLAMHGRSVLRTPSNRWNLQRLILAAQQTFYWNLHKNDAESHGYKPGDEDHPGSWEDICNDAFFPQNLLTQAEATCLGRYKGNKCNLLFAWYERDLRSMLHHPPPLGERGLALLPTASDKMHFERTMLDHVVNIKGQMASTLEVQHLKVPFSYYHLTYLLLLICLILLAYAFVFINDNQGNPLSLVIYPAVVAVLSGLQEQANKMSDPFGSDESDMNTKAFVLASLDESRALCFSPDPPQPPRASPPSSVSSSHASAAETDAVVEAAAPEVSPGAAEYARWLYAQAPPPAPAAGR